MSGHTPGPFRGEYSAISHAGETGFLFTLPNQKIADEVASGLNADILLPVALAALKKLAFMARTAGGTAGPDEDLKAACEAAETVIAKATGATET